MRTKVLIAAGCLLITLSIQIKNTLNNASGVVFHNTNIYQPGFTLSPGLSIDDNGKKALVFGDKVCSDSLINNAIKSGCIFIEPGVKTVAVTVSTAGEPLKKELWAVERAGQPLKESIRLKRPDGTYVTPWGYVPVIAENPG
ncbi:hypothetical protein KFO32_09000 [Pantoea ananatis]|uniref:hypothetical protein n=1 Tax=Pantoea ananas TaxID=553 RepID=UPI001FF3E01F|nr:hypothetical protein [Pantoea ananatis]MCK0553197.1 hypothetical protein [Pantoea ananatis]